MIKTVKSDLFGTLNLEIYHSANAVVDDLVERKKTDSRFKPDEYADRNWVGASREEAYKMLREGYQPVVDKLKSHVKVSAHGTGKRVRFTNEPAGFIPIVPNAILGLPNSMINSQMKPIKTKVLDVYYDITASAGVDSKDLMKAGEKLLSAIMELEANGYRFNLYVVQNYYDDKECDMLCVRVKTASQPLDLKRISFPVAHTAFFRGIGFEWYSKFPIGKFRFGYGHSIAYDHTQERITKEFKKLFGQGAVFFSAPKIMDEKIDYLKGVLTNDKMG